ncbi:MAG: hypothetical protein OXB84_04330, partial [Halobacteriovoraceae bacterium]|nr:hypothetical protein [Halobacteriovoraceae bacterium]
KNVRPFLSSSLIEIKLKQLITSKKITNIIVSTDDEDVISRSRKISSEIIIHNRSKFYASSDCDTNELSKYFASELDFEHLMWTHVTSPFIQNDYYDYAISQYVKSLSHGYDSLFTVEKCQSFVWDKKLKPINYDVKKLGRWPKTQEVTPLFIINSGLFLISKEVMLACNDRVGFNPYMLESDKIQSFDIDCISEFKKAENLWKLLNR